MSAPMKFRKKPVVIQAVQWDGSNANDVKKLNTTTGTQSTCTVCGTAREASNNSWTFHWTKGFTVKAAETCSDGCAATYEAN